MAPKPTNLVALLFAIVSLFIVTPTHAALEGACPDTVVDALKSVDAHLQKGNWVNIDVKSCQNLQTEIVETARQHIDSGTIKVLIPLMSAKTMRIARNTPYATHGYRFGNKKLREHFDQYSWYQPTTSNPADITLSRAETEFIDMVKFIERKWTKFCKGCSSNVQFDSSQLPNQVKLEKNTLIFPNRSTIDVTPRMKSNRVDPETQDRLFNKVTGIDQWDSVVACEYLDARERGVDLVALKTISLFAAGGTLINKIDTASPNYSGNIFSDPCPSRLKSQPDFLISFANRGCCGDSNDVLITYDNALNVMSKAEGVVLLMETLGREIYYLTIEYIRERSEQRTMDGYNYSLWNLDSSGNSHLLTSKTTELLYKDNAFYSYGKNQHVNLYEQAKKFNNQFIATATTMGNNIILFWFDDDKRRTDGITVIPIPIDA